MQGWYEAASRSCPTQRPGASCASRSRLEALLELLRKVPGRQRSCTTADASQARPQLCSSAELAELLSSEAAVSAANAVPGPDRRRPASLAPTYEGDLQAQASARVGGGQALGREVRKRWVSSGIHFVVRAWRSVREALQLARSLAARPHSAVEPLLAWAAQSRGQATAPTRGCPSHWRLRAAEADLALPATTLNWTAQAHIWCAAHGLPGTATH